MMTAKRNTHVHVKMYIYIGKRLIILLLSAEGKTEEEEHDKKKKKCSADSMTAKHSTHFLYHSTID